MLRQEDPHPTPDTLSAAQTRVTPEELAHAIASLEARRLDETRHQEGTIPIGEAVRELGLDATPEEVLAEVRAQREARNAAPPPSQATPPPAQSATANSQTPPTPPLPPVPPLHQTVTEALRQAAVAAAPGLKQAALAASPALKQGMDAVSRHVKQPKQEKSARRRRPWTAFGIVLAVAAIVQSSSHHSHPYVQEAPQARYLSTVPDGHEVHADTATVLSIAQGADPKTVAVLDGVQHGNTWTLVRHDKHWYVHANALESATVGAGPLKIYNQHNAGVLAGEREQDVTLRLDTSELADTNAGDTWSEIDMSQVHPDIYTHEDW